MPSGTPFTTREGGFSMIEVLVALLVLSIGLLAVAGLQANSLKMNTGAYLRSQANQLAYDMADRLRGNRAGALDGHYAVDAGKQPGEVDCDGANTCGPEALAQSDLHAWKNKLDDMLPSGEGRVETSDGIATVTVFWDAGRTEPPKKTRYDCENDPGKSLECLAVEVRI